MKTNNQTVRTNSQVITINDKIVVMINDHQEDQLAQKEDLKMLKALKIDRLNGNPTSK